MQDKMIRSRANGFREIEPSLFTNPVQKNGQIEDLFVGHSFFAVVKLQLFRGIKVAVKEVLPRTVLSTMKRPSSCNFPTHMFHTYLGCALINSNTRL